MATTLKEIEESILKLVEVKPEAKYVVLVSDAVDISTAEAVSRYLHERVGADAVCVRVGDAGDIRVLEVSAQ